MGKKINRRLQGPICLESSIQVKGLETVYYEESHLGDLQPGDSQHLHLYMGTKLEKAVQMWQSRTPKYEFQASEHLGM